MKVAAFHSHLNGREWLMVHRPGAWEEIVGVIEAIDGPAHKTKESEEKGRLGELVYAPKALNVTFGREFAARGWHPSQTTYWATEDFELTRKIVNLEPAEQRAHIEQAGRTAIKSYNQTDFVKDRVAIEVQFGKYSFIAFDLFVKHLAFYVGEKIDVGVEILAMKAMQGEMSSGPGYYEWAIYQIARQGRGAPPVPLVLIGVLP